MSEKYECLACGSHNTTFTGGVGGPNAGLSCVHCGFWIMFCDAERVRAREAAAMAKLQAVADCTADACGCCANKDKHDCARAPLDATPPAATTAPAGEARQPGGATVDKPGASGGQPPYPIPPSRFYKSDRVWQKVWVKSHWPAITTKEALDERLAEIKERGWK